MRTAKVLSIIGILLFLYSFSYLYILSYYPQLLNTLDVDVVSYLYPAKIVGWFSFVELWVIYPLLIIGLIGILSELEWGRLLTIHTTLFVLFFDVSYVVKTWISSGWSYKLSVFILSYIPFFLWIVFTWVTLLLTAPLFRKKIVEGIIPPEEFFKKNIGEIYFKIED